VNGRLDALCPLVFGGLQFCVSRHVFLSKVETPKRDDESRAKRVTLSRFGTDGPRATGNMDTDTIAKVIRPGALWQEKSEEELLIGIAAGDEEEKDSAFREFYYRHAAYLHGACEACLNEFGQGILEQDDLFTVTLGKVYNKAHQFRADGATRPEELQKKVRAWMGEIATNELIDRLRARIAISEDDSKRLDQFPAVDAAAEPDTDPVEVRLTREAIATLKAKEQIVVWAMAQFYRRGVKQQRIGSEDLAELARTAGTTKVNFRQMRCRARKKIEQYVQTRLGQ
jgi:DNA-directed RNA polymerase specialized sigma24 family protein